MKTYRTKITAPRLRNILPRERLFSLLDTMETFPVTWVCSRAGSGKTILLASYLKARGLPSLWYRVDEADGDVASFFYYMSEAATMLKKGRNKPLPLFTPECRAGMLAFTRYYFESLFSRMAPPYAIVLDNYQDAPEPSQFHEVMRNAFGLVPEGIRIFVASRSDCRPSFVSLKAGGFVGAIGWEDIRFSFDEVREMLRLRRKGAAPEEEVVRHIHRQTQGWAAGAILLSEQEPASLDRQPVFDYLAEEVFRKLPDALKAFLLKTSLLPSISPDIAVELTGRQDSEAVLSRLRGYYFTERYGREYSYHPLFREFLIAQARRTYEDEYGHLAFEAGRTLARAGRKEEAIKVFLDVKAYDEALPLIIAQAPELLKQGRSGGLEEWTERMPRDLRDRSPLLLYWLGMGRLMTDPTSARGCFEKAFALFDAQGEKEGCLLAAADVINSIVLEWDDFRPLDPWIEYIDRSVGPSTRLASPEMEARVASAMVSALWRRTYRHPHMNVWIERTLRACAKVEDVLARFTAKASVMEYYGNYGHEETVLVAKEFREAAFSKQIPPLAHLMYMVRPAYLTEWIDGSWDKAIKTMQKALHTVEEWGAYSHVGTIYAALASAAFEINDLDFAGDIIQKMGRSVTDRKSAIRLRLSLRRTFYLFRKGKLAEARAEAKVCLDMAERTGGPLYQALARLVFAYVLRLTGERTHAYHQLETR